MPEMTHLTFFLPKAEHGLLALGTPDPTLQHYSEGAVLNSEVTNRQHTNSKIGFKGSTKKILVL